MKTALFLVLALGLNPALARADIIYKCRAINTQEEKNANLRFEERGDSGSLEVEYWNDYPPVSLLSSELRHPVQKDGAVIFQTKVDATYGYSAELKLPVDFLQADFFQTSITLVRQSKRFPILFDCNRF